MATAYGGWGKFNGYSMNAFRVVMDYSISSTTDTACTVKIVVKCQMGDAKDAGYNFSATGTISGTSKTATGSTYQNMNGTYTIISSHTKSISRTQSAQSISVSASVRDTYMGGSSSTSASVSVPALPKYAITYNANGGSGAPAAGSKFHNDNNFKLSTTKPTRTNYTFLGWSTSSTATSATYAAGASYTGNAALTLYAVWKLAFVAPTISKLTAFRSDSSGDSDPSSTSYIHVDVTWSVDTAVTSGNKGKTVAVAIKSGSTQVASGSSTVSATSGTTSFTLAPTTSGDTFSGSYIVTATITDTNNQTATKTTSVSVVFKPFTMTNAGLSAAFFGIAQSTWNRILKVFGNVRIQEDSFAESTTPSSNVYGRGVYLTDANDADVGYVRAMKLTNGQQGTQIETRRIISGANKYNTLNLLLDDSGNPVVAITAGARPKWFGQIAAWTKFADFNSGTETTISIPAAANEILVFARCTNTTAVDGVNVRRYSGTVLIPKGLIDTTGTEWMLGGGSVGSTSSGSGTRYCAIRLTTTKALGVGAYCDGTLYQSSTHFYMYWR